MKIRFSHYCIIKPFLLSLIIFFSLSCSDDPSSPKDIRPSETVTIGPEGGTVEKGDLTITVPAGAFAIRHDISIVEIEDDPFGDNSVSSPYKISGMPNSISEPIQFKIKYFGELSEQSYLAIGANVYEIVNDDSSVVYDLYPVIDSSGYLIGELPISNERILSKPNNSSSSSSVLGELLTVGLSGYKVRETQNFKILYPSSVEIHIDRVETIFENNLSMIRNELDINYFPSDTKGAVVLRVQDEHVKPQFQLAKLAFSVFNVGVGSVIGDPFSKGELNIAAARSLIWRENKFREETGRAPIDIWYQKAIFSWIEELLTYSGNYKYPELFSTFAMNSFDGFVPSDFSITHGVGMASVIKYLTEDERFGKASIGKTWEGVTQTVSAAESILNTMDALKSDWWPDYFKEYISGNIYQLPENYFITNAQYEWSINSSEDSVKVFDPNEVDPYSDLSAKLFMIDLNYPDFTEEQNIVLSMKGPITLDGLSLIVWGIQNGEIIYLETAHAQDFEIPNIKEYYDNNMRQFLVCLVNSLGAPPYQEETDIDLTIKVTSDASTGGGGNGEINYNYCELSLFVNKFYEREDGSTFEQEVIQPFSVEGEMIGNRFVAKSELYVFADTLEITFNESGDNIELLNWINWYRTESPSSTQKTEIEAFDIPISDANEGIFKVSGLQTCGNLTHYSYYQDFQGNITTVTAIDCNENSYLEIKLSKR